MVFRQSEDYVNWTWDWSSFSASRHSSYQLGTWQPLWLTLFSESRFSCQQAPNLSCNQHSVSCWGTRTSGRHPTKVTQRQVKFGEAKLKLHPVVCHFLLQGIFPTQGSNPHLQWLFQYRRFFTHWAIGEAQRSYSPVFFKKEGLWSTQAVNITYS